MQLGSINQCKVLWLRPAATHHQCPVGAALLDLDAAALLRTCYDGSRLVGVHQFVQASFYVTNSGLRDAPVDALACAHSPSAPQAERCQV
jgi:hypothetical protein